MKSVALIALVLAAPAAAERAPVALQASASVQAPLDAMVAAIQSRDAEAVGATLSSTIEPRIDYYWGETVTGRSTIVQWHREWFAEKGWTIERGPVSHALVGDRLATLTTTTRYVKSAERQFRILISYTLAKEAAGWKVARIQQTLLEGPQ